MKKINRIKLFVNNNSKSEQTAKIVTEKLLKNNFLVVDDDFDLAIAIGGDGSFLRMVKSANFNSSCIYVGINAGTLGFAQEVSLNNIDTFIKDLSTGDYKIEEIGVQEIEITTSDTVSKYYSLNELVLRDKELNTTNLSVLIDGFKLEDYAGDGLLIASSFGSTAYNLSFGGSIVYNTFHTLQITPIAPLNNKSYRNLLNSVIIPDNKTITIIPKKDKNNLIVTIDGDNNIYNDIKQISMFIRDKTIQVLRMNDYNFAKKINDKFLKWQ